MSDNSSSKNEPDAVRQSGIATPDGLRTLILRAVRLNAKQYTMFLALIGIWLVFAIFAKLDLSEVRRATDDAGYISGSKETLHQLHILEWTALFRDNVFLSSRNLSNLFVQTAATAVAAIGIVLVIVAGHIDLSIGSVLGFTGGIAALAMVRWNMGMTSAILLTLAVGLVIGAWHGFWVAYRKVPAFIVTLASMLAFRGLLIGITGGQTQGLEMAPEAVASSFKLIGQGYLPTILPAEVGQVHDTSLILVLTGIALYIGTAVHNRVMRRRYKFAVLPAQLETFKLAATGAMIFAFGWIMVQYMGIPWAVLLVLGLTMTFNFVAKNTTFGRHLYAIGGNSEAARLSGINVARHVLGLYMLMGVMTAAAGIVFTARLNAATTSAGQNAELDAIASAVIGGTSLMGGEGTVPGAVVGALVMTSLDNGMSLMNLDVMPQYIVKGLILLLAVWVDMAQRKK